MKSQNQPSEWLGKHSSEIKINDLEDSISISLNQIPNSKIYGLGEASHLHEEFFKIKSTLIKNLIKTRGLNTIYFEESYGATTRLNDYLVHGDGNPKTILSSFRQKIWNNSYILKLFEWINSYNSDKPFNEKVKVYGIDSMFNYDLSTIIENIVRNKIDLSSEERKLLNQYSKEIISLRKIDHPNKNIDLLETIKDRVIQNDNFSQNSRTDCVLAIVALQNYIRFMNDPMQSTRDQNMKEIIVEHIEVDGNFKKAAIWSHNLHIQKASILDLKAGKNRAFNTKTPSLGERLKAELGNDYYAIGFDFATGELAAMKNGKWKTGILDEPLEKTLSYRLYSVPYDAFFFDFKYAMEDPNMEKFLNINQLYLNVGGMGILPNDIKKALSKDKLINLYDGLIFVKRVSLINEIEK